MIKKFLILISLIILLSSCQNNSLQNENGEIIVGESSFKYIDGVYTSYLSHFDEDGYASVMRITVHNGVINSINFDYFDKNAQKYSEINSEQTNDIIAAFRSDRRLMNTLLLQSQTINPTYFPQNSETATDYISHARLLLHGCSEGNTEAMILTRDFEYKQSTGPNSEGYHFELEVTYQNETSVSVTFMYKDSSGKDSSSDSNFLEKFRTENGIEYNSVIEGLNVDPTSIDQLTKQPPINASQEVQSMYAAYNSLISIIDTTHKNQEFSLDLKKLF